jgi:hypothetical protein
MIQLEKKLEESASALSKLTTTNDTSGEHQQKDFTKKEHQKHDNFKNANIVDNVVQQIQIPIAYSVNANVISVQNAATETLLDIVV